MLYLSACVIPTGSRSGIRATGWGEATTGEKTLTALGDQHVAHAGVLNRMPWAYTARGCVYFPAGGSSTRVCRVHLVGYWAFMERCRSGDISWKATALAKRPSRWVKNGYQCGK